MASPAEADLNSVSEFLTRLNDIKANHAIAVNANEKATFPKTRILANAT